jgi:uncharacterized protein YkwD
MFRLAFVLFVLCLARPAVAAPPAPPEHRVAELVNRERARHGLAPLRICPKLSEFARGWSRNQAARGSMYHSSAGYRENVATGQDTADGVMRVWMNSPGHRANILSSRAKTIGVGLGRSAGGRSFWTQVFQ